MKDLFKCDKCGKQFFSLDCFKNKNYCSKCFYEEFLKLTSLEKFDYIIDQLKDIKEKLRK